MTPQLHMTCATGAALLALLLPALACSETTVTVLTQAPPGRQAFVDSETRTLTISRGVAVALECTAWTEQYAGPCREVYVRAIPPDQSDWVTELQQPVVR